MTDFEADVIMQDSTAFHGVATIIQAKQLASLLCDEVADLMVSSSLRLISLKSRSPKVQQCIATAVKLTPSLDLALSSRSGIYPSTFPSP